MNTKAEAQGSVLDTVKLVAALVLVTGAVGAFYYYSDASILIRVLGLLAVTAVAVAIAIQTDRGRQLSAFVKESQIEVRKVVWPTKQETVQTTLLVMLMVILVAIFLWLLDLFLGWFVRMVTG
jgi:preprotein translocase subunit SecE